MPIVHNGAPIKTIEQEYRIEFIHCKQSLIGHRWPLHKTPIIHYVLNIGHKNIIISGDIENYNLLAMTASGILTVYYVAFVYLVNGNSLIVCLE